MKEVINALNWIDGFQCKKNTWAPDCDCEICTLTRGLRKYLDRCNVSATAGTTIEYEGVEMYVSGKYIPYRPAGHDPEEGGYIDDMTVHIGNQDCTMLLYSMLPEIEKATLDKIE